MSGSRSGGRSRRTTPEPRAYDPRVVPEAPLNKMEHGLVAGEGWFVLNARDARWRSAEGRGAVLSFDGWPDGYFPQYGVALYALERGQSMGMYHWEADQEDFFVLSGEALLLVEGEERSLRQWDIVHCPPGTNQVSPPCVGRGVRRPRGEGRRPAHARRWWEWAGAQVPR